jgi:hypothetical protein
MFTTLAVVALSGLTAGKVAPAPVWLDDYRVAQTHVSEAGKPMAVFVGNGKASWESVIRDGFDPATTKMLSEKFVCLYVDTTTTGGRALAGALQVGDRGLVISDKSGRAQAYSANGTVSASELQRVLLAYADPAVVTRTEIVQAAPAPPPPPPGMAVGGPVYVGGPGYMGGPGYIGTPGGYSTGDCGGGGFGQGHGGGGLFGGGAWGFGSGHSGMGCHTASMGCGGAGAHYASAGSCGGHTSSCGFGGFLSGGGLGNGWGGGWGHGGSMGGGCGGLMSHGGGCK